MGKPIKLIWARDLQGAIGANGSLPWHLPEDLAHFKRATLNSVCVMGRKTWDSIGRKGLPGRPVVVLTRNTEHRSNLSDPWTFARSVGVALRKANELADHFQAIQHISVLGGATVYARMWPLASEIVETVVHARVEDADTWLPAGCYPSDDQWELVSERRHDKDSRHAHMMDFLTWRRKP